MLPLPHFLHHHTFEYTTSFLSDKILFWRMLAKKILVNLDQL